MYGTSIIYVCMCVSVYVLISSRPDGRKSRKNRRMERNLNLCRRGKELITDLSNCEKWWPDGIYESTSEKEEGEERELVSKLCVVAANRVSVEDMTTNLHQG